MVFFGGPVPQDPPPGVSRTRRWPLAGLDAPTLPIQASAEARRRLVDHHHWAAEEKAPITVRRTLATPVSLWRAGGSSRSGPAAGRPWHSSRLPAGGNCRLI